jgi:uncharacterized damage-inducible protein DinB
VAERIDPPPAADELTTLRAFLDFFRASLAIKVEGLTDEQARAASVAPSDLNLMGLVRHLADVERSWFQRVLLGLDTDPIWYGSAHPTGDPDGDLHPGPDDTLADALAAWRAEIAAADAALDGRSADDLAARESRGAGGVPNVRWILVHLIEEYARHCGHADLIRQAIDGSTGD